MERLDALHSEQRVGWLSDIYFESAHVAVTAGQLRSLLSRPKPWALDLREHPPSDSGWEFRLVRQGIMRTLDVEDAWRVRVHTGLRRITLKTWGGLGDSIAMTPILDALQAVAPNVDIDILAINEQDAEIFEPNPAVVGVRVRSGPSECPAVGDDELVIHLKAGNLSPQMTSCEPLVACVARAIGLQLSSTRPSLYTVPADQRAAAKLTMDVATFVAIHVASRDAQKDWPVERWDELVRIVSHVPVIQVGAAGDPRIEGTRDARGVSLRSAFAMIERAAAFVGVDSALQHAAAAFQVPSVVLFGPSADALFGHEQSIVLRPPWCGCYRQTWLWRQCERECMANLPVRDVVQALTALIDLRIARNQERE